MAAKTERDRNSRCIILCSVFIVSNLYYSHKTHFTCLSVDEVQNPVSMEEGKEIKGNLTMEIQRISERVEERDRLSELPDDVLLHIMTFMNIRIAVQTCILSKRWENLWKGLTTLSFDRRDFNVAHFFKFINQVLSVRDGSISLLNLHYWAKGTGASVLWYSFVRYAVLHNVQQLTIVLSLMSNQFAPLIFSCKSLTFLKISVPGLKLPKSLHLPALKSLHLSRFSFTASDNGYAEPFSSCNSLDTLVLKFSHWFKYAEPVLCICNSSLSSLKLQNVQHDIVLSTPNLSSLTIVDKLAFGHYQPSSSSTCNLSFLEEGNIHSSSSRYFYFHRKSTPHGFLVIIGWLQLLANVKTLTLSSFTLKTILNDLSSLATMKTQPPSFVRLETLKVKMDPLVEICHEEIKRTLDYLLQNTPLTRVAVINC